MPHLPDPPTHSAFRLTEKHFKNKSHKNKFPSLRSPYPLLDLSRPEQKEEDEVWKSGWWSPDNDVDGIGSRKGWGFWKGKERDLGERPDFNDSLNRVEILDYRQRSSGSKEIQNNQIGGAERQTIMYKVADGCILLPNYLSESTQLSLIESSLSTYTLPPNPLSLSTHYTLPPDLFSLYASQSDQVISPKYESLDTDTQEEVKKTERGQREMIDTEAGSVLGYEEVKKRNEGFKGDLPSDKLKGKTAEGLMREIRWANLGWVYQWSTKSYDFSVDDPIPFPSDLKEICKDVIHDIPWDQVFGKGFEGDGDLVIDHESWEKTYEPDTGIVNFYQLNDTLMGHVDRSELDPSIPLVSISLGHAAIFLLGSTSREVQPIPLILRSGDVLVMSGKGRQAYHGVPRILEGTLPKHLKPSEDEWDVRKAVKRWISTARININARQVFPPGFERPRG